MTSLGRRVLLVVALASLAAPSAQAQQFGRYRLKSFREDRGVHVGAFHVIPEFFFETRYDNNLFRGSDDEPGDKIGATIFRLMPAIEVKNPKSTIARLFFWGMGDLRVYHSGSSKTQTIGSTEVSHSEIVKKQAKYGGNARVRAHFFPTSLFQLYVQDRFDRSLQTRTEVSAETFTRLLNEAGGGLILQPAASLSVDLGYSFTRDIYEESRSSDKSLHEIALRAKWDFFPRTSVYLNGAGTITRYDEVAITTDSVTNVSAETGRWNSLPVRVEAGMNGYITSRFFVTLGGGYGNSLHEKGGSYNGPLGRAAFGYEVPDVFVGQIGYTRGFNESLFANYYGSDAITLATQVRLWQRVDFDLKANYRFLTFGDIPATPGVTYSDAERKDQMIDVEAAVSLNFLRYLGVNIGAKYSNLLTDFTTRVDAIGKLDYASFQKIEVFGNLVVRY